MAERVGPCPLSRCSLEWFLAGFSIWLGVGFFMLPLGLQMQQWLLSLPDPTRSLMQPLWGGVLILAGGLQYASLRQPKIPQHVAAFISGLAWLLVVCMMFQAGLVLVSWGSLMFVAAEVYVAARLKP